MVYQKVSGGPHRGHGSLAVGLGVVGRPSRRPRMGQEALPVRREES